MRIGIDARLWSESGVGRYTRNLVGELQKIDKTNEYVLFVLSKDSEEIRFKIQDSRFKIQKANIRWHTIEEQLRFPSILNKEKLDLVHFPYFSVPVFYTKPFVVTIHDLILHHFPTGQASTLPFPLYKLKLLGYKFVIAQAAARAQKIITVSFATKQEIIKKLHVDQSKIVVTYEGIDDKIKNSKSQTPNKSQNTQHKILNTKFFLYVGNAYPHKNLERLVEAFALFCYPEFISGSHRNKIPKQVRNDTGLVLVGKEDYFYKRLKEKIQKMGLEESIVFYGNATDEELVGLYKNALALVMPSVMEGFGLPVLEAMANTCLVLAADIPALREICADAAIYFDPFAVTDIAKKMREVCFNDVNYFSKNINTGVERAKMFSWEKMAKETLAIYESSISV